MTGSARAAIRVAQIGTGNVGVHALRALITNPDYELTGVWVSSEAKAGKDAGELAGLDISTGIAASTDLDAVLATGPQCAVYTAMADNRLPDALEDYRRILAAGVNVVGSSAVFLQYPWQVLPDNMLKPIEDAAQEGNSSLFVNGIDPGFANDLIPLALAGTCQSIQQIRCMEIVDYATYDSATVMFDVMGFGKPLDEIPMLLQPGVLSLAWGSVVRQLAAGLGVELDQVTERYERIPAPEDFDIASGHIPKGSERLQPIHHRRHLGRAGHVPSHGDDRRIHVLRHDQRIVDEHHRRRVHNHEFEPFPQRTKQLVGSLHSQQRRHRRRQLPGAQNRESRRSARLEDVVQLGLSQQDFAKPGWILKIEDAMHVWPPQIAIHQHNFPTRPRQTACQMAGQSRFAFGRHGADDDDDPDVFQLGIVDHHGPRRVDGLGENIVPVPAPRRGGRLRGFRGPGGNDRHLTDHPQRSRDVVHRHDAPQPGLRDGDQETDQCKPPDPAPGRRHVAPLRITLGRRLRLLQAGHAGGRFNSTCSA